MSGKLTPFSPLYEPIIRDRYVDTYLVDVVRRNASPRSAGSLWNVMARLTQAQALQRARVQLRAAVRADLYFARSDMVSLAVAAMLDDELPEVEPPSDAGLVLLEGGVRPIGSTRKDRMLIYGLLWYVDESGLQVVVLPDVLFALLHVKVPYVRSRGELDVVRDTRDISAHDVHGVRQDVALLRAMFALWREPHVVESHAPRPERLDRVAAKIVDQAKHVRVVDVREHVDDGEPTGRAGESRRYRPYDHRFIVSGHWREQACGPNHSERRRKWIAPFVKGPADKPLIVKDTVRVWRGKGVGDE